ncbi:hypothetical protein Hanom_Chr09g00852101 [Helianthus anomalus]
MRWLATAAGGRLLALSLRVVHETDHFLTMRTTSITVADERKRTVGVASTNLDGLRSVCFLLIPS